MMKPFKVVLHFYLLLFSLTLYSTEGLSHQNLTLPREDQNFIEAYLTPPKQPGVFPLILLVQGSDSESVFANHETLAERFIPHGIAVLSMEKRGVHLQSVDNQAFIENNYFESRVRDYVILLQALDKELVPKWNGELILLAGSEGGKIAPRLALQFSKHTVGIVLVGSGGGIPFGEELKFQIEIALSYKNAFFRICSKIYNLIIPREVDIQYAKMLQMPNSLELWNNKTYRWWASYLNYDPLPEMLLVQVPIYMIHGSFDPKIPVESADSVKAAFDEMSKHNLTYARYEDLGHAIKGREDVYFPMVEWVKGIFFNESDNAQ